MKYKNFYAYLFLVILLPLEGCTILISEDQKLVGPWRRENTKSNITTIQIITFTQHGSYSYSREKIYGVGQANHYSERGDYIYTSVAITFKSLKNTQGATLEKKIVENCRFDIGKTFGKESLELKGCEELSGVYLRTSTTTVN